MSHFASGGFRSHLDSRRGARHRCGCLHLLLSAHPDGPDAEAIYEYPEPRVRQRPDEYVRERSGLSARGFQGGCALKLRHPLFHCVA